MIEINHVNKWYGPSFQALKDCTTKVAKDTEGRKAYGKVAMGIVAFASLRSLASFALPESHAAMPLPS